MTTGPGKYDYLCTIVREEINAAGVIVIVLDGNNGNGFSCQFADPAMLTRVPGVLEEVAAQIRKDMVAGHA